MPINRNIVARLLCTGMLVMSVAVATGALAVDRSLVASYAYEDTQALVTQVEEAADTLEREGLVALTAFARRGSRWYPHEDDYLFVYALDGTCLFNPAVPQLVGQPLLDLEDAEGRRPVAQVVAVGQQPQPHARGWIFYLWARGDQISPAWKSSYIRKATLPDGRAVAVGAGRYSIKPESVFLHQAVAAAASLVEAQGPDAAQTELRDPRSPLRFQDVRLFMLDATGKSMTDPTFPNLGGRDFKLIRDANNNRPVMEILNKLKNADEATVQYLQPKPGTVVMGRKYLHVRRARWQGHDYLVGGEYFLPIPIWVGGS